MIRGLLHFKNYFKFFANDYILIGGVATYLQLEDVGADKVRATKDLDIVLMMNPRAEFLKAFKDYIKEGGYEIQNGEKDKANFYRFMRPSKNEFPIMIELFATIEDDIKLFEGQHIIPIKTPPDIYSLSAILIEEEYYSLIRKNATLKDEINLLNPFALIPFKAKAYLEIRERKEDTKNWKKHRGDIINLAVNFLTETTKEKLTGKVRDHFIEFMKQLRNEINDEIVLGACGQKIKGEVVIAILEKTFL